MGLHLFAIDRHQVAPGKGELDLFGLVGGLFDRNRQTPHAFFRGRLAGILENAAFVRDVQQVGVHGEGGLAFAFFVVNGNPVLVCIGQQLVPGEQIPLTPGRDDLYAWHERVGA